MNEINIEDYELMEILSGELSIQPVTNGRETLVLMCKDSNQSLKLLEILSSSTFGLKITIDDNTGFYSLAFHFTEPEWGFRVDTRVTEKDYPPITKLKANEVKYITTGVWTGKSDQGRQMQCNMPAIRLGYPDIADSFNKANEIQFHPGRTEEEPSIMALIFSDYEHVINVNADEAYNHLLTMSKSRPTMEIRPSGDGTLTLKIWDILVDLDVNFSGLKYNPDQLENFLRKTGPNTSFAFALGMIRDESPIPALLSTKPDGYEMVTLHGYSYVSG